MATVPPVSVLAETLAVIGEKKNQGLVEVYVFTDAIQKLADAIVDEGYLGVVPLVERQCPRPFEPYLRHELLLELVGRMRLDVVDPQKEWSLFLPIRQPCERARTDVVGRCLALGEPEPALAVQDRLVCLEMLIQT
jgi:hypothetical protein